MYTLQARYIESDRLFTLALAHGVGGAAAGRAGAAEDVSCSAAAAALLGLALCRWRADDLPGERASERGREAAALYLTVDSV